MLVYNSARIIFHYLASDWLFFTSVIAKLNLYIFSHFISIPVQ